MGSTSLIACPLCDTPLIDADQAAQVKARLAAQESARAQQWEKDRLQLQAEARKEGMERAHAANKQQFEALVAENASLKDNMESAINEGVNQGVAAEKLAMEAKYAADAAQNFREKQGLREEIEKLRRAVDSKSPNELGDVAEIDLYRALKEASPDDKFTRIDKGTEGGDVEQIIIQNRSECGKILYEGKNTKRWSDQYAVKLHADQLAAKADWGVCVTSAFPPNTTQLEVRQRVILCAPDRVVSVMRILRHAIIKLSLAQAAGKDADAGKAAMYAFFTSGAGHALLLSASDDVPKLRALDKALMNHAKKHVDDSEKVYKAQMGKLDDICAAIDRIARGEDDGAAAF